jgi:hypothetical protein
MSNRVDTTSLRRAEKVLRANLPPRFFRLDTLERYVEGTQYEGKPSFLDDSVALLDRAPRVVYLIAQDAIRSNVDLVLGEGRFPTITSLPGEDDEEYDDEEDGLGLDEDDSAIVDRGIASIMKQVRGPSVFREVLEAAQGCGTAVVIGGVRNGKICLETTLAKWCTPTFDPQDQERITQVEIRYPYLQESYSKDRRKWTVDVLLYRRVIDEKSDTTFRPARANEHGDEPDHWEPEPGGVIEHGFGFCPVRWYKHAARCLAVSEVDGRAVHALLLDEIDALNFSLSQHDRAALYVGDPQMVETGVDEDVQQPMGQQAFGAFNTPLGGSGPEPDRGSWRSPGVQSAAVGTAGVGRKRGPGVIYRYPSEKSKLTLLTLPGDALDAISNNVKGLLTMLREGLAYVSTDPESMKMNGDISGRFLEWLYRKQLNRCDNIRADFGDKCLLPVVDMLLRIVLAKGDGIRMRGVKQLVAVLQKFEREVTSEDGSTQQWVSPELHLRWGPYFPPTETDQKAIGESVRADLESGLITKLTGVEKLAPFYGIKSAHEYVEMLEKEAEEKLAKVHDAAEALGNAGGVQREPGASEEPTTDEPATSPSKLAPASKLRSPKPGKRRSPEARA